MTPDPSQSTSTSTESTQVDESGSSEPTEDEIRDAMWLAEWAEPAHPPNDAWQSSLLAEAYHRYRLRFPGGTLFCGDAHGNAYDFDSGSCSCRMDVDGMLAEAFMDGARASRENRAAIERDARAASPKGERASAQSLVLQYLQGRDDIPEPTLSSLRALAEQDRAASAQAVTSDDAARAPGLDATIAFSRNDFAETVCFLERHEKGSDEAACADCIGLADSAFIAMRARAAYAEADREAGE